MNAAAFQVDGGQGSLTPVNQLVGADELLRKVWPEERSRPSLRWLRAQQKARAVPFVPVGRRVFFCVAHVLAYAGNQLTVRPRSPAGTRPICWPTPDILVDAVGLTDFLAHDLGIRRSLRWVRQQQADRALPFIRWGRKVLYSPAQVRAAILGQSNQVG
jgi:hypothetical protein